MKSAKRIRWKPAVLLLLLPLVLTACHTGPYPPEYDIVYEAGYNPEPYRKEMGSDISLIEGPDDFFTESGLSHMYELRRGKVYRGRDTAQMEITEKQLKEHIRDHISRRTGIAHEIGVFPYLQQYVWASSET